MHRVPGGEVVVLQSVTDPDQHNELLEDFTEAVGWVLDMPEEGEVVAVQVAQNIPKVIEEPSDLLQALLDSSNADESSPDPLLDQAFP